MGKIALMTLLLLVTLSCTVKKGAFAFIDGKHTVESPCPEGDCTFEVLKDKALNIQTDGTGMPYYSLEDMQGKVVVLYTYDRLAPKDVEDAEYKETIVFETDTNFSNLNNANPKDVKMLFGVQCFCRGKAGFYRVNEGTITYSGEKLSVKIQDNIVKEQHIHAFTIALKK